MTTSPPGDVGEADPDELVAELVALAVVCLLARRLAALRLLPAVRLLLVMRVRAVLAEVRACVWRRRTRQLTGGMSRMWAAGQGHRREASAAARQARDRHVQVIRRPRRGPCGAGRPPAPPRPSMPSTRA